jgi:hypothetical protein
MALLSAPISRSSQIWASGALAIVILVQLKQVFLRAINWDEFWHYSQIHQMKNGALTSPLQSIHTNVFEWVTYLPGTGVDHIVIIRLFMFGFEMMTVVALIGLATRFMNRTIGLLSALAYLTFPYVFQHGYSFRFDPPSIGLMMAALWIIARFPLNLKTIAATCLLVASAAMVTIKIVLLAPAFAGIVWLRWSEHDFSFTYLARLAALAVCTMVMFATFYTLHSAGFDNATVASVGGGVERMGNIMFKWEVKPYWMFALRGAALDPIVAFLIISFPFFLYKSGCSRHEKVALIGLYLPITTLVFYHNTAPYYYAFMLPTVLVACSVSVAKLVKRFDVAGPAILMLLIMVVTMVMERESPINKQRALLEVAERVFSTETRYFDLMGMLGLNNKANNFMTPVGLRSYHFSGVPIYTQAIENSVVPLVVENDPMFTQLFNSDRPMYQFMPEDASTMRDTYIHFWGPYWLAGEEIPANVKDHEFRIRVPGTYRVEGSGLSIEGRSFTDGDLIQLDRGLYKASVGETTGVTIIWAELLDLPQTEAPEPPYFLPF